MSNGHFDWTFLHAAKKCDIINVLSSALWCCRICVSFTIIYYHFFICEWGAKMTL